MDTLNMSYTPSPATLAWLTANGYSPEDWQRVDQYGNNALACAIMRNETAVAEELLSADVVDVNQCNHDGNNTLWFACFRENLELIDRLMAAGVQLDHQNAAGATCLMYSASASKTAVVEALLKHGANEQLKSQDDFTALDFAGNRDILKLLRPMTQ
jgi:ankyrin repeat protein